MFCVSAGFPWGGSKKCSSMDVDDSCQCCLDLFDPVKKKVKSKGQSRIDRSVEKGQGGQCHAKVTLNGCDDIMSLG